MVSDTAFRAIPTRTSYCSSKAALNSLTESLRLELKILNNNIYFLKKIDQIILVN